MLSMPKSTPGDSQPTRLYPRTYCCPEFRVRRLSQSPKPMCTQSPLQLHIPHVKSWLSLLLPFCLLWKERINNVVRNLTSDHTSDSHTVSTFTHGSTPGALIFPFWGYHYGARGLIVMLMVLCFRCYITPPPTPPKPINGDQRALAKLSRLKSLIAQKDSAL